MSVMLIMFFKNKLNFFFNSSYFKFGILVGLTYLIELIIFYFLTFNISIFYANFIASIIGVSLDYFFALSKKLSIFNNNKKNKILIYFLYLIFIFCLISINSYLIKNINNFLQFPVFSKVIIIPLSYTIHWYFFYFIFEKKLNLFNKLQK
jgi:hypothetical protein